MKQPPTTSAPDTDRTPASGVADTIKGWITERRENNEAEDRSRRRRFSAWTSDPAIHATAA